MTARKRGPSGDPGTLRSLGGSYTYTGTREQIIETSNRADGVRAEAQFFGGGVFAFFCLPLIWYFLLDRIREISGAISRKDRNS